MLFELAICESYQGATALALCLASRAHQRASAPAGRRQPSSSLKTTLTRSGTLSSSEARWWARP